MPFASARESFGTPRRVKKRARLRSGRQTVAYDGHRLLPSVPSQLFSVQSQVFWLHGDLAA